MIGKNINLSSEYEGIEVSVAGQIYFNGKRTRFNVKELVPKKAWDSQKAYALGLLRPKLIQAILLYRDWFDTTVWINTWPYSNAPGNFHQRCYRFLDGVGARYSRHKYGMAFDSNVKGLTAAFVYKEIMDNQSDFYNMGFTTIEDIEIARTWGHLDIRWTDLILRLKVVKP